MGKKTDWGKDIIIYWLQITKHNSKDWLLSTTGVSGRKRFDNCSQAMLGCIEGTNQKIITIILEWNRNSSYFEEVRLFMMCRWS